MLLETQNLYFSWPTGQAAVAGVSFGIRRGEMVALVGPNGAGKSTLLRLLSGFLKPARGSIALAGKDIGAYGRRDVARLVAFVPQYSDVNLPFTVAELVTLARYPHVGPFGALAERDRNAVKRALALAEVEELAARPVGQLSGGEFQRVILARALAQEPSLVFLDEPTAHLDLSHEARMLTTLARLNAAEGLTVVAVLHDVNAAASHFARAAVMAAGRVVADGPPAEVLTPTVLSDVYGWPVEVVFAGGRRFIYPKAKQ